MTASPPARSALLSSLFPAGIVSVELREPADPSDLYDSEARVAATFGPKRATEFAAGRLCARHALAELGERDFPLLINDDRTPRWPKSVVGSITHTDNFCAAVVARRSDFRTIGVDAEVLVRVSSDLWPLILTTDEAKALSRLPDDEKNRFAAIAFSAKEAFYKSQFPITRAWLDFEDVDVTLDWDDAHRGSFTVAVHSSGWSAGSETSFAGRFSIDGSLVVAGVSIPAAAGAARKPS